MTASEVEETSSEETGAAPQATVPAEARALTSKIGANALRTTRLISLSPTLEDVDGYQPASAAAYGHPLRLRRCRLSAKVRPDEGHVPPSASADPANRVVRTS
jgi:hypothetical protein